MADEYRIREYIMDGFIPEDLKDDGVVEALSESPLPYHEQKFFLLAYVAFLEEDKDKNK